MRGPRLLALFAVAIGVMVAAIVLTGDATTQTAGTVTRWTARSSLVLFLPAFVARPAMQLWKTRWAKYLLAERKWFGLGFATSHATHLGGIIAVASPAPAEFIRDRGPATLFAALTFLILFAMAFTSIERVKRAMSPTAWKLLHRTGMWFAWIAFATTYLAAIAVAPGYALAAVLLVGALGIRIAATFRHTRRARDRVPLAP